MEKCIEELEIHDRNIQLGRERVLVPQEDEYIKEIVNGVEIRIPIPGAAQRNQEIPLHELSERCVIIKKCVAKYEAK